MKGYSEWLTESSPVLEVPDGVSVDSLPLKHFVGLAKRKGRQEIVRALTNLEVWFIKKKPELSQWAKQMKADLAQAMGWNEE